MTNLASQPGHEWYHSTAGTAVGPVSIDEIRRLVAAGQLLPQHHVRHSTWPHWSTVADAAHALGLPSTSAPTAMAAPVPASADAPWCAPPVAPTPPSAPSVPSVPAAGGSTAVASVATFGHRIASWAIDGAILTVVAVVLNQLPGTASVWATLLTFGAYVGYTVVLPWKGVDTLGHRLTGMSVRDAESGERVGLVPLAARSAVVLLLALPLLLGIVGSVVGASAHPRARAWHDVATGSVLLRGSSR